MASSKLKLQDVAYFSAEHSRYTVKSLLSGSGRWTTPPNSKLDSLEAEFSLAEPCQITGIDVGNFWSGSVEILVGSSKWPQTKREVLLPEFVFMNRLDCSQEDNIHKMMFFREAQFNAEVLAQKWDRIKVVCRQPFKINNDAFGLAMFVLHGVGQNSSVEVSANTSQNQGRRTEGLDMFKKKADGMAAPRSPYVPSVLKNLENLRKMSDTDGKERPPVKSSASFNSSSLSRTGKLVVQAQSNTGKKANFQSEAKEFLLSCNFEKQSFAEIETITFRQIKELWLEKKKCELKKDEKDVLKSLSTAYLTKLLSNPNKRQREEDSGEKGPPKKRKVSEQLKNLRKNTEIDELYDDTRSNMRNQVATLDVKKKVEDEPESDEDIKEIKKKFILTSSTPIPSKTKKINFPTTKTPKSQESPLPQEVEAAGGAVFALNSSPEISPVKEKVSPKPVKQTAPSYNRKLLLSVPHDELIKTGVLVQVYNYKKDKKLPLKGDLELSAKKGVPVTFFKVGPDVHLEYQGRFYLPDIEPEHLERVFKNFSGEKVLSDRFPDDLDGLLKMSSKVQCDVVKPVAEKLKSPTRKSEEQDRAGEPGESGESGERGECPLCQQSFPVSSLPDHAAGCDGTQTSPSSSG